MNKKILIPALTLLIGGGVLYTSTQVPAMGVGFGNDTLIQKLASAFGKSEDEVRAVFDEVQEERHTEMLTLFDEKLDDAIASGELTQEQKQLISAKHEELKSQKESLWQDKQNLSKEEWLEMKQVQREKLESWAQDNGIDLKYFFAGYRMHKGMHGFGEFGHFAK